MKDTKEVPLDIPTEVDPSLIPMTQEHPNSLALLIMDNGSKKNLVSHALVNCLNLDTTSNPHPFHLRWFQKDGPCLLVSQQCLVIFSIDLFKDIVLYDVSPLDCSYLLLGIPYQSQINSIYMAKYNQYKFSNDSHTYIVTTAKPETHATKEKTPHV